MFQYIVSFAISIVIFLAIQYYFNNYNSYENKNFFNNNKYYIFIALFILINSIMYFYFNNSFIDIVGSNNINNINPDTDLKEFENNFVNNIKNQEVDVGVAPF